jgi:hypothetical protein
MPRIPDEYLDCAIYLYASEADAEGGAKTGGSGFLIGVLTRDLPTNFWFLYAITNKHVVHGGGTVIRMTTIDGEKDILATDERQWVYHPGGDDLAACLITFDPKAYKFHFASRGSFLDKETVSDFKIGPGDDVFVVGRFVNHEGKQRNNPSVRFGCIAQMPLEPIRQDGFDQESFLVEARSIGGYSGSPVFAHIPRTNKGVGYVHTDFHGGNIMLLGVDWGHINDWEPVRDASGRPVNPSNPKQMQVCVNTGMMAVVPAWKLAELLDDGPLAEQRRIETEKARKGMEDNPPPATPD